MLDKLKSFAESLKGILFYIVVPVTFVVGFIYYLLTKNSELKTELRAKDGQEKLNELHGEQEQIDHEASDAVDAFERLRQAHNGGRDDNGT